MNRTEFLKRLKQRGIKFLREGKRHEIFVHVRSGKEIPISRKREYSNDYLRMVLKEVFGVG